MSLGGIPGPATRQQEQCVKAWMQKLAQLELEPTTREIALLVAHQFREKLAQGELGDVANCLYGRSGRGRLSLYAAMVHVFGELA